MYCHTSVYVSSHEEVTHGIVVNAEMETDIKNKSIAERMMALEEAKHLLSQDEYQSKREQILSSL
jgi:hypothetical protein